MCRLLLQTYGFKDYKAVGVVLQRGEAPSEGRRELSKFECHFLPGLLILAVAMFPIWVLWLNAEPILLLLQQPPCVARWAAVMCESRDPYHEQDTALFFSHQDCCPVCKGLLLSSAGERL